MNNLLTDKPLSSEAWQLVLTSRMPKGSPLEPEERETFVQLLRKLGEDWVSE